LTPFKPPTLARINDSEASGRILLLQLTDETQRFKEVVAETDIGQPWIVEIDAQSEVVKFLAHNSLVVGDACGKQCHTEACGREQRRESAVELVAEASSALADDLRHEALGIEDDLTA
jgi:hypothetical protein